VTASNEDDVRRT